MALLLMFSSRVVFRTTTCLVQQGCTWTNGDLENAPPECSGAGTWIQIFPHLNFQLVLLLDHVAFSFRHSLQVLAESVPHTIPSSPQCILLHVAFGTAACVLQRPYQRDALTRQRLKLQAPQMGKKSLVHIRVQFAYRKTNNQTSQAADMVCHLG